MRSQLLLAVLGTAFVPHLERPTLVPRRRGSEENEGFDPLATEPRLSTPPETLAAAAVGTGLAAAAGIEVLDAGVMGSSLLVGAALAWAAENEKEYGVGDVARGIGKLGWKAFKAAREAQVTTVENVEKLEPVKDSFQTKLEAIRKGIEEDRAKMAKERESGEPTTSSEPTV